ncbi:DNA repair protein RecO C-terminal domain-containing protein [Porphyromonadaceae bacterium OttesenSCG-928-L07]|nr:DNA repair protein RecO C-terminal domain-containing protein [Porphyromonadaceae bacterium OttesenSCG-928-L07]MDL2252121.1 DNA repair protein RecO C-terminal domain-containing protein [Odoribacter sp. OttesenSCG-928-J03]MDL2330741.1 DNA repair protein RecO C-terminal domain-containing protein [Odoribacter sp. OttesenSCG-928-A06]
MEVIHAIVLKIFNYSDTQKIVRVFSKEKGYLSLITPAYVLKQKRSSLNMMQVVEMEYYENTKSEFHKLKSIAPLFNASSLYLNIFKMNIALLWGEVLDLLLRKEQKNEVLYTFISRSVEYLNESSSDTANFNLFFLYRLSIYVGFKINTDTYDSGYVFNINDGNFTSPDQKQPYISGPNTAKIIYDLCTFRVEEIKNIVLNRESRRILLDIILLFYSIHLNIDFNIKSIKVIREVFE